MPADTSSKAIVPHLPPAPAIYEPWQPAVGDYVRVNVSPECRMLHGHLPSGVAALYGRVEIVDRSWDDPSRWAEAAARDGEDLAEMLATAADSVGHYYTVSDSLGAQTYALVDGQYAALELARVPETEALAGIEAARAHMATLTRSQRALARLGLAITTEVRR